MTWIILGSVMLVFICVLLIPINIYVNTVTEDYVFQLKGFIKINIAGDQDELICIRIRLFFMNFMFYPLQFVGVKPKESHMKKKPVKRKKGIGLKYILRMLRSFKVKEFLLFLDTGNYMLNAQLYPIFFVLNQHYGVFNINFEGKNQLVLQLHNRPIYILKSLINF
ncbi:hypothetical protein ACOCEA_13900 [Maribacter sp. CXY002]|uniref:hypothetical protein n=1 Tax=Maribacter luteocoastalis TaxID=3407671 RepID=UPI003B67D6E0